MVLLTAKLFDTVADRNGLEGLTVIGKPFDPQQLIERAKQLVPAA